MIWLRLGCAFYVTPEEMETLMNSDQQYVDGERLIHRLLRTHLFEPCGDTYIPAESIEAYNNENGTDFKAEEVPFYL